MMKIKRADVEYPSILKRNHKTWGKEYQAKKEANNTYRFVWKTRNQQTIDKHIIPILRDLTHSHCSYCDAYPMGPKLENTIDHFRPKELFPLLVYVWANLFLCCRNCQKRLTTFNKKLLLKPDKIDFDFHKYFIVNYVTGEIEPNPKASVQEREQATYTINAFRFNEFDRPTCRLEEIMAYDNSNNKNTGDYSYRFLFA
ncbi:MAG: hypothetical protein AB8B69_24135 [Chitinophagales bacterium]